MKARTLVVLTALLSVIVITGATAFTSASVARETTVSIQNDSNGVIGLQPGEGTKLNSSGVLVINLEGENLNKDATFTYGDTSSPTTTFAFNVTNNDDQSHSFQFTHNGPSALTYKVYDSTGTKVMTLTSGSKSQTIASGATYYVVIEVNTGLTTGTNTGSLEISV